MKRKAVLLLGILVMVAIFVPAQRRILFIGDSITDGGWGNSGGSSKPSESRNHKDKNHLYGHSYMMLCAAHYESSRPDSGDKFFNRGISGDDLSRLESRWKKDVIDVRPDVLSLLVGTNDISHHLKQHKEQPFDFEQWEQRYRALLDSTRCVNPDIRFMLGTPFVAKVGHVGASADYRLRDSLIHKLANVVTRIATDYDAALVRYDSLFLSLERTYPEVKPNHWIWDGIHPTAAGHRRMADLWIEVYEKTRDLIPLKEHISKTSCDKKK